MGQYFMAVNKTKQEYVLPWELDCGAKLWEWCANPTAGIFPYLLRKSDDGGGGDVDFTATQYAGRWAGDEVYLVGDYDSSALFLHAWRHYHNIAQALVAEYNQFMDCDERQLCYTPLP